MPRRLRESSGGVVYHVLNRAVGRGKLFDDDADYLALLRVIQRTIDAIPMRIITYCLMPNHWHLVLWPRADGELSEFMRLLTVDESTGSGVFVILRGHLSTVPLTLGDPTRQASLWKWRLPSRSSTLEAAAMFTDTR